MAYLHRIWRFRPAAFHADLIAEADIRTSLHRLARDAAAPASAVSAEYLEMVRFDSSWLNGDIRVDELYVVAMANYLEPASAYTEHILRLPEFLKSLGWSGRERTRVLQGDKLSSLAAGLPPGIIREQLIVHLDDWGFGGWLSSGASNELSAKLKTVERAFRQPSREFLARADAKDPHAIAQELNAMFDGITGVLDGNAERPEWALRIVSD